MTELVRTFIVAGVVVSVPALAQAEPAAMQTVAGGVLRYALFEAAVPHVDLADCPVVLAAPDRFCRLTLGEHGPVVWAFGHDADQTLQAVAVLDPEALTR